MVAAVKYYCAAEDLAEGVHDWDTHTLKIALTNTAPDLTDTTLSDADEITAGNGYTAGGATVTVSSSSQTTGLYKLIVSNVNFTASGGSIATFRYVVLYNATANRLIQYWDSGSNTTVTNGNTYTCTFDGSNGVIQIQ